MKKHIILSLICATLLTAAGFTMAAPSGKASPNSSEKQDNAGQGKGNSGNPSPKGQENGNRGQGAGKGGGNGGGRENHKIQIAHCGCGFEGLEWKHIYVSVRARGHLRHNAGTTDECIIGDTEETFVRTDADCRLSDEPSNNIGGLGICDPIPEPGTSCGAPFVEEPEGEDGEES